jgi:hypothetical protein
MGFRKIPLLSEGVNILDASCIVVASAAQRRQTLATASGRGLSIKCELGPLGPKDLLPNVTFAVFDACMLQKCSQFLLKLNTSMMLCLPAIKRMTGLTWDWLMRGRKSFGPKGPHS